MENIEDLKEILSAMQEIGNALHEENVSLREENSRLLDENKNLRTENESLRRDINNFSEQMKNLLGTLRDDIISELDANTRDEFQKSVKTYLKDIRDKLNATPTNKSEETTPKVEDFLPSQKGIYGRHDYE